MMLGFNIVILHLQFINIIYHQILTLCCRQAEKDAINQKSDETTDRGKSSLDGAGSPRKPALVFSEHADDTEDAQVCLCSLCLD